jgi:hypothetical protein
MKPIQDENIFIIVLGLIFCIAIIWWIRIENIKETEKLNQKGLEMDSSTKSRSLRVYMISGTVALIFLFEILKRLYIAIFS